MYSAQKIARTNLQLAGPTGGYLGEQLDPAKTINLYSAQIPGEPAPALVAFPGTHSVITESMGESTRNSFQTGEFLFVVYGDQLIVYDTDLLTSTAYTINTTAGVANFAATNAKQVILVDGVDGWIFDFNAAPTFTQITDPVFASFNNPLDVAYLDGHIFVVFGSGNKWLLSNFEDASTYNALHQAEINSAGNERLKGVRVSSSRVYFFGSTVTELWYPTGQASDFPFAQDSNSTLSFGCVANRTIAEGSVQVKSLYRIFPEVQNCVIWLAASTQGTPKVLMASMGLTNTISDMATEYKIQQLDVISDAVGVLLTINGTTFYILTFPTGNLSLVYNFDMKEWYELQMIDGSYYFASCHSVFNNKHYLGSLTSPTLSEMNDNFSDNDGNAIHCVRTMGIFNLPSYERLEIPRLELEMRMGTGDKTTTPQTDLKYNDFNLKPEIYVSHSVDGGYHFSQQRPVSTGAVGDAQWKVMWQGFPVSPRHVFRFDTFNATKTILVNAFAQIQNVGY